MNNGAISGNNGHGVFGEIEAFTMNDGSISRNNSSGVFLMVENFSMNGGTISSNKANIRRDFFINGFLFGGGGVSILNGNFTKSGGTITGYSSDPINGNVIKGESGVILSNRGHAVFVQIANQIRTRETTAGPGENLSVYWNRTTNQVIWDGDWVVQTW
jgi:hypothetical protein